MRGAMHTPRSQRRDLPPVAGVRPASSDGEVAALWARTPNGGGGDPCGRLWRTTVAHVWRAAAARWAQGEVRKRDAHGHQQSTSRSDAGGERGGGDMTIFECAEARWRYGLRDGARNHQLEVVWWSVDDDR